MQVAIGSIRHDGRRGWKLAVAAACALLLAACGGGGDDGGSSSGGGGGSLKGRTMVVASWGGTWTEAGQKHLFQPFAKATGVKVVVATPGGGFFSQVDAQQKNNNIQWDLLDAPSTDTTLLQLQGYLEQYPDSLVQTIKPLVRPEALRPSPDKVFHLLHGQTADIIACNPERVRKCPTNAKEFFDVQNFPGTRGMTSATPVMSILFSLLADGVPRDQLYPIDLERAKRKLEEIKPNISVWPSTAPQSQQILANGEVDIEFVANSIAYPVLKTIPNLELHWNDALELDEGYVVQKNAPNKDVAFEFIKWFAEHPENQAGFTKEIAAMTPAKNLHELIPAELAAALPVNKQGTVLIDGVAVAKQAKEIGQTLRQVLVAG